MSARIFITYARSDGSTAAEQLVELLAANGHSAWQDLRELGPEETVWPQIEKALKAAEYLIVLVTPAALKSDYIRKEWREARRNGATIIPVRATDQSRSTLPRWLRRGEVYDLAEPTHVEKLLALLNTKGGTFRADWDDGLQIKTFIARPRLFAQIKTQLLSDSAEPLSLTSALQGRGGYGKSVLAGEIARDPEIRDAYIDGVFWVSLGQDNPDVLGQINHLIRRISGTSGAPDVNTAAEEMRRLLEKRDVLIILDDVWRKQDLMPWAKATGHGNASLLATTRKLDALPPSAQTIDVTGMEPEEAVALLSRRLGPNPEELKALSTFASDFWHWPQLLAIANGILRARLRDGQPLLQALATVAANARKSGLPGQDERERTVANVMQMGIDDLPERDRHRFLMLACLPEDTVVPVAILAPLWHLSLFEAEEFARTLLDRSLIQSRDLSDAAVGARIRMHDDMLWYLGHVTDARDMRDLHLDLLAPHRPASGNWAELSQTSPTLRYLWRHLLWHLEQAERAAEANGMRVSFDWIAARLAVTGIEGLLSDYRPTPSDQAAATVGAALLLSQQVLGADPAQLGWQLAGRLGHVDQTALAPLKATAWACTPFEGAQNPPLTPPGALRLRIETGQEGINSTAFSPDGTRIVSGGIDGTLRLWDATTGAALGEPLRGHVGFVLSTAFSPDSTRIISGGTDHTLRLWDVVTGAALGEPLRGHEEGVFGVAFAPDGTRIVSGGIDGTLRLWDAATGAALGEPLRGHQGGVWSIAFSADGTRIVSGGLDGTLRIWDAATGTALGEPLRGHEGEVFSVAFSRDGTRIVSGSQDRTLRLWDAATAAALGEPLLGHKGWVNSVTFSPDGRRIVSCGEDRTLRLWDAITGAALGEILSGHEDWVRSVACSPDGKSIISGGDYGILRLWDNAMGSVLDESLRGHQGRVNSVAFSPDGRRIASGGNDRALRLLDAATGAVLSAPSTGHENSALSVAFSPDGTRIVSGGWDGTLRLWDAATGAELGGPLRGHEGGVRSAAFSPDGKRIVSGSYDQTLRLWDAVTGAVLGEPLRGHAGWLLSTAFSPDGTRIVSGCMDGTLRLWDAATGAELGGPLRGHEGEVNSVAFSPDGKRIVSGSHDQTLGLWDAVTGAALGEPLRGHVGGVSSVAFSPDGTRIVSGGADDTLRIWDAVTGCLRLTLAFDAAIMSVSLSPSHLALGDGLGRVHILRWRENF